MASSLRTPVFKAGFDWYFGISSKLSFSRGYASLAFPALDSHEKQYDGRTSENNRVSTDTFKEELVFFLRDH